MKKKRIHFQGYILIFVGPKCFIAFVDALLYKIFLN